MGLCSVTHVLYLFLAYSFNGALELTVTKRTDFQFRRHTNAMLGSSRKADLVQSVRLKRFNSPTRLFGRN